VVLKTLFKKYRSVGVVGNTHSGKSSLVLELILNLKAKHKKLHIYLLGIEPNLHPYLTQQGMIIVHSIEDVLDLKIKNSIIYIDEFADLFHVQTSGHQLDRVKRFFNRIAHLNNYVIISSAQVNFWNKFICSLVKAHLVKAIDFNNLVRGTTLRRKIINIAENTSEYRLEVPINTYYIITDEEVVGKKTFPYNKDLDSKRDLPDLFCEADGDVKDAKKSEEKVK